MSPIINENPQDLDNEENNDNSVESTEEKQRKYEDAYGF